LVFTAKYDYRLFAKANRLIVSGIRERLSSANANPTSMKDSGIFPQITSSVEIMLPRQCFL
jgi:hypothetical protein